MSLLSSGFVLWFSAGPCLFRGSAVTSARILELGGFPSFRLVLCSVCNLDYFQVRALPPCLFCLYFLFLFFHKLEGYCRVGMVNRTRYFPAGVSCELLVSLGWLL